MVYYLKKNCPEYNMEYKKIGELVERDIKNTKKKEKMFQVQCLKNKNKIDLVEIGEYDVMPIVPIMNFKVDNCKFDMFSYLVTDSEVNKKENLRMIGIIGTNGGKIVGSLDFIYNQNSSRFEIIFSTNEKNINKIETLRTIDEYPGKEESIHLLTSVLVEDVI